MPKKAGYLARFTEMARRLEADKTKAFLGYFAMPPASDKEIAAVEKELGSPLDASINRGKPK